MQTPKARIGSSEVPQKVSPRAVRQLKTTGLGSNSASSCNQASRTQQERSPQVVDRRSPRSPASEKKRPTRISELESRISQLQEDLKKSNDQLNLSELWKKQSQQDTEETKQDLLAMSSKLEQCQQQLREVSASKETRVQIEHSIDTVALASAVDEIQQLKVQLEMVAESEVTKTDHVKMANSELHSLKGNLTETLTLVENMKSQLMDCKESETLAQALVIETLMQLENAKKTVEALRLDGMKSTEAYNSIASELDQSRARVSLLEGLVSKIEADPTNSNCNLVQPLGACNLEQEIGKSQVRRESNEHEAEIFSLKSEVQQFRSALETAETKYQEEQIRYTVQIRSAYELLEQTKATSSLREGEFEAELAKTKSVIEELKANLMDKETELQGISEENEELHMKLEKNLSCQGEYKLAYELQKLKDLVADMKANLMDKETELQNRSEENEMLRLELKKREMANGNVNVTDDTFADIEAARNAAKDALTKLGAVMEEADKSNKKVIRVTEQLEASQAMNSEMEAELRRLKVQSDQWRKAAEAAAAMLSSGNNGKFTGSMDNNYSTVTRKMSSPYSDDMDDDLLKKKNGNMLKKIGVLWKKPQK